MSCGIFWGRLQLNFKMNIKGTMCEGVDRIMDQWWASVSTVMNLRFPCAAGKFWQPGRQLAFQARLRAVELDSTQYARMFPANFSLANNDRLTIIIRGTRVCMTKIDFKTICVYAGIWLLEQFTLRFRHAIFCTSGCRCSM